MDHHLASHNKPAKPDKHSNKPDKHPGKHPHKHDDPTPAPAPAPAPAPDPVDPVDPSEDGGGGQLPLDPTKLVKIPIVPVTPPKSASNLPVSALKITQYKDMPIAPRSWNVNVLAWGSTQHEPSLTKVINVGGTDVWQLNYPKGSYKPSKASGAVRGGAGLYCLPPMIPKGKGATLSYDLWAPAGFNPMMGGKIPGTWAGDPAECSGGKHGDPNTFSMRLMWRQALDENTFLGEAYAYISPVQHPDYKLIPGLHENLTYGSSLWRGEFKLYKNQWNHISVTTKLNTKGNFDGFVSLTINDTTRSFNKLKYVDDPSAVKTPIGACVHSFFGGGTPEWATDRDTSLFFANFNIVPY